MPAGHVFPGDPAAFVCHRSQGDERVLLHQPVINGRAVPGCPDIFDRSPHFPVHQDCPVTDHADTRIPEETRRRPHADRHHHDIAAHVAAAGPDGPGTPGFLDGCHRAADHHFYAVAFQFLFQVQKENSRGLV